MDGALNWIDLTSLGVLLVFGILGLFRGFLWQASRLLSLVLGYLLASLFAPRLGPWFEESLRIGDPKIAIYLAFFAVFIAVLVVLSIVTMILQRIIRKLDLSFYDHLGGGIMGVLTGGALIVAFLGLFYWIAPSGALASELRDSRTGRFAREVVGRITVVPAPIRRLYTAAAEASGAQGGAGAREAVFKRRAKSASQRAPADSKGK